jgi:hypothetical protein
VTDDPQFGILPQFSRDVSILSRLIRASDDEEVATRGVLPRFSGVLDVHVERGRPPLLDLSYLALESLIAPHIAKRATRRGASATTGTVSGDSRSGEPLGRGDHASRDEGDESEPTVGDVIHGDSDIQVRFHSTGLEEPGLSPTHLRLRPDRPADWSTQSDRMSNPDRADQLGSQSGEPSRTPVDQAEQSESIVGDDSTTIDRFGRARDDTFGSVPDLTVGSQPDSSVSEPNAATDPASDDPWSRDHSDVEPPRMVAEGHRPGRRTPGDTADNVPPSWSLTGDEGGGARSRVAVRSDHPAVGTRLDPEPGLLERGEVQTRPRMVLDRDNGGNGESVTGSDGSSDDASGGAAGSSHGPTPHTPSVDDIGMSIPSSTDPESRLVDQLYRTLKERHEIEQRRKGNR